MYMVCIWLSHSNVKKSSSTYPQPPFIILFLGRGLPDASQVLMLGLL